MASEASIPASFQLFSVSSARSNRWSENSGSEAGRGDLRDEVVGHDEAAAGALPAHQPLEAERHIAHPVLAVADQPHLGLEMELELAAGDAVGELGPRRQQVDAAAQTFEDLAQFVQPRRLADDVADLEVVRPGEVPGGFQHLAVDAAHDHDRPSELRGGQPPQHLDAVERRHLQVDHGAGLGPDGDRREERLGIGEVSAFEAAQLRDGSDVLPDLGFVVEDENPVLGHRP